MGDQVTITRAAATEEERFVVAWAEAQLAAARAAAGALLAERQRRQDAADDRALRRLLPPEGAPCYTLDYEHRVPTCHLRGVERSVFLTDGAAVWRQNRARRGEPAAAV